MATAGRGRERTGARRDGCASAVEEVACHEDVCLQGVPVGHGERCLANGNGEWDLVPALLHFRGAKTPIGGRAGRHSDALLELRGLNARGPHTWTGGPPHQMR